MKPVQTFFTALLCLNSWMGSAQTNPDTTQSKTLLEESKKIFSMYDVQKAPAFPGGEREMYKYINSNLKFPTEALEKNVGGVVVLGFIVEKSGAISDITLVKDIGYGCGQEGIRLVKSMPIWEAGEATGQKVRVRYTLPVQFRPAIGTKPAAPAIEEKVYAFSEVAKPPAFPGGDKAMYQFIASNMSYPPLARENGVRGTVAVDFVIDETGVLKDIHVTKDIGSGCGKEALRVVKAMPPWIPGEQDGKKVKVRYSLPLIFRME